MGMHDAETVSATTAGFPVAALAMLACPQSGAALRADLREWQGNRPVTPTADAVVELTLRNLGMTSQLIFPALYVVSGVRAPLGLRLSMAALRSGLEYMSMSGESLTRSFIRQDRVIMGNPARAFCRGQTIFDLRKNVPVLAREPVALRPVQGLDAPTAGRRVAAPPGGLAVPCTAGIRKRRLP